MRNPCISAPCTAQQTQLKPNIHTPLTGPLTGNTVGMDSPFKDLGIDIMAIGSGSMTEPARQKCTETMAQVISRLSTDSPLMISTACMTAECTLPTLPACKEISCQYRMNIKQGEGHQLPLGSILAKPRISDACLLSRCSPFLNSPVHTHPLQRGSTLVRVQGRIVRSSHSIRTAVHISSCPRGPIRADPLGMEMCLSRVEAVHSSVNLKECILAELGLMRQQPLPEMHMHLQHSMSQGSPFRTATGITPGIRLGISNPPSGPILANTLTLAGQLWAEVRPKLPGLMKRNTPKV